MGLDNRDPRPGEIARVGGHRRQPVLNKYMYIYIYVRIYIYIVNVGSKTQAIQEDIKIENGLFTTNTLHPGAARAIRNQ